MQKLKLKKTAVYQLIGTLIRHNINNFSCKTKRRVAFDKRTFWGGKILTSSYSITTACIPAGDPRIIDSGGK